MSAYYEVTSARNAGERDNPRGGKLTKWYLTLRNGEGKELLDVYSQRKPENQFVVGQSYYGTVKEGDYGPRLYLEQPPEDGSQTPSAPAQSQASTYEEVTPSKTVSGPKGDAFWAQKDRRISRAGILQAVVASGVCNASVSPSPDLSRYVSEVNHITDALMASLDERTPSPNQ